MLALPSRSEHTPVGIVPEVRVLDLAHKSGVIHLPSEAVHETQVDSESHVIERSIDVSLPLRLGITAHDGIHHIIFAGNGPVPFQKDFISGGRIDSEGAYRPYCRRGHTFHISWQRGYGFCIGIRLVHLGKGFRNLEQLVGVVGSVEGNHPVCLLGLVPVRNEGEIELDTLVLEGPHV